MDENISLTFLQITNTKWAYMYICDVHRGTGLLQLNEAQPKVLSQHVPGFWNCYRCWPLCCWVRNSGHCAQSTYIFLAHILENVSFVHNLRNEVCEASVETRISFITGSHAILEAEIGIQRKYNLCIRIKEPGRGNQCILHRNQCLYLPLWWIDILPTIRNVDAREWTGRTQHHEFTLLCGL